MSDVNNALTEMENGETAVKLAAEIESVNEPTNKKSNGDLAATGREGTSNARPAFIAPRRSARKSIKPIRYGDLVSGTLQLRSASKALFSHGGNTEAPMDGTPTKLTPAKAGRSSEKDEDAEGSENKIPRTNKGVIFKDDRAKKIYSLEDEMQPLRISENERDELSPPIPASKLLFPQRGSTENKDVDANAAEDEEEEDFDMEPLHVLSFEWDEEEDFDMEPLHVSSDECDEDECSHFVKKQKMGMR